MSTKATSPIRCRDGGVGKLYGSVKDATHCSVISTSYGSERYLLCLLSARCLGPGEEVHCEIGEVIEATLPL